MRIGITGMAWSTALGQDPDDVWQRLLRAESGIVSLPAACRLRNDRAAAVSNVDPALPPAQRLALLAGDTVGRALFAAGRSPADPALRWIVGTSFGSYIEDDPPATAAHAWADAVAARLGLAHPPILVSTACSAGADAILVGAELIRGGAAACCVCGGVDVLTLGKRLAHSTLGTLSPTTLRAFDVRHDGTLLGEGAAFLVLSAVPDAGPSPLAWLRGAGSASDACGMTAPDATGHALALAIERSLADAGIAAADLGVIKAHASGTPLNDQTEREAFNRLFTASPGPVVFGTKGNFGHSLGATGAIEAMALVLSLRAGVAPPVLDLEQPDPDFRLPLPCGAPVRHGARFGLGLTLGFGGFDTSLVFERCA